jgi:hypothetical protein
MTATIYMMLRRLIEALDADVHSLVPAKVLPKVFIFGDLLSLAAQLTGKLGTIYLLLSAH